MPAAKKKRVDSIINFLLIKNILELILLISSVLAAILIWSWIFMKNDFIALAESATAINREYYAYNQDAKKINDLIKNINLSSQNFTPISPKLKELINSLPNDVKLNYIQLDRQNQTLTITGTAATRAALLGYQNILNKISWITQVETPVSQLFQKDNINFEFKAQLKGLALKSTAVNPDKKP
jgi:Tfp pilus assembly protein PilN